MSEALTVHVLNTGYCLTLEALVIRGGRWRQFACPCLVALIRHPERGWVLWDTGYSPRMLAATERLPYSLYRLMTPLRLHPDRSILRQLPRLGIAPEEIRTVIISHFHADHLGGLSDFPAAAVVCTSAAWAGCQGLSGMAALRRGFLPQLVPPGLEQRLRLVEAFSDEPLGPLGPANDLFGDGTLRLIPLPGHAPGQIGLYVHSAVGPMLFTADGAWLREAIRSQRGPHGITTFMQHDPAQAEATLRRLHELHRLQPEVTFVPTHCPEATRDLALADE